MKKLYLLSFFGLISSWLGAQMLTPTVISTTGGFSSNANGSLSYTVGEMTMVETFSANGNILTQGFQQPTDKVTGILDFVHDAFGSFVVYPNPAVDNFWFGLQLPESGKVTVGLFDVLGQKLRDVYNSDYQGGKIVQETNVSEFAAGVYLLTMTFTSDKDGKDHVITKKFHIID